MWAEDCKQALLQRDGHSHKVDFGTMATPASTMPSPKCCSTHHSEALRAVVKTMRVERFVIYSASVYLLWLLRVAT